MFDSRPDCRMVLYDVIMLMPKSSHQPTFHAPLLVAAIAAAAIIGCGDDVTENNSTSSTSGATTSSGVGAGGESMTTTTSGTGGGNGGSGASTTGGGGGELQVTCSNEGVEMISLLNDYRQDNGLPAIPVSPSLCSVAQTHVVDLTDNAPDAPAECNLHSWSDQGSWSACCYTPDHAQAQCMWVKPSELTSYPGTGYENAASGASSPADALALWKGSAGHNAVMLNEGIWENYAWGAVGAALHEGRAALWFGVEADPER